VAEVGKVRFFEREAKTSKAKFKPMAKRGSAPLSVGNCESNFLAKKEYKSYE